MAILLVAAGVGLARDEHQARVGWGGFWFRGMVERAQDAKDCDIGGENAEADGSDHGEAENQGHHERNHGRNILLRPENLLKLTRIRFPELPNSVVSRWSSAKIS